MQEVTIGETEWRLHSTSLYYFFNCMWVYNYLKILKLRKIRKRPVCFCSPFRLKEALKIPFSKKRLLTNSLSPGPRINDRKAVSPQPRCYFPTVMTEVTFTEYLVCARHLLLQTLCWTMAYAVPYCLAPAYTSSFLILSYPSPSVLQLHLPLMWAVFSPTRSHFPLAFCLGHSLSTLG